MGVIIIAEAGVNHNGSVEIAKEMINEAKKAGVDYIKFQTFVPEKLVSKYAKKAEYQKETTGKENSQLEMLKNLALSYNDFRELKDYCDFLGIGPRLPSILPHVLSRHCPQGGRRDSAPAQPWPSQYPHLFSVEGPLGNRNSSSRGWTGSRD